MRILVLEDNQFIASIIVASFKGSESELVIVNDQFEAEKQFIREEYYDSLGSPTSLAFRYKSGGFNRTPRARREILSSQGKPTDCLSPRAVPVRLQGHVHNIV